MNIDLLRNELRVIGTASEVFAVNDLLDRRLAGPLSPNAELKLFIGSRKLGDLKSLALICHYLPSTLKFFLQEAIEYRNKYERNSDISLILASKAFAELYFSRHLSERDFYGNWKKRIEHLLAGFKVKLLLPKTAVEPVRRRGYRDHGGLRPEDRWQESHDWSLTQMQNALEQDREFIEACFQWNISVLSSIEERREKVT
jgi:glycogen debranching enzyme